MKNFIFCREKGRVDSSELYARSYLGGLALPPATDPSAADMVGVSLTRLAWISSASQRIFECQYSLSRQ